MLKKLLFQFAVNLREETTGEGQVGMDLMILNSLQERALGQVNVLASVRLISSNAWPSLSLPT